MRNRIADKGTGENHGAAGKKDGQHETERQQTNAGISKKAVNKFYHAIIICLRGNYIPDERMQLRFQTAF